MAMELSKAFAAFMDGLPPSYFRWPVGGETPVPISCELELASAIHSARPQERVDVAGLRKDLNQRQSTLAAMFCNRMAVYAAREKSPDYLKVSLQGLAFVGRRMDWRDLLGTLSILYTCGKELQLDMRAEFMQVRPIVEADHADLIDVFFKRSEGMRSPRTMGFATIDDGKGPTFRAPSVNES